MDNVQNHVDGKFESTGNVLRVRTKVSSLPHFVVISGV